MANRQFLLFLRVKEAEKHSTEEVFVEAVWTDLTYDLVVCDGGEQRRSKRPGTCMHVPESAEDLRFKSVRTRESWSHPLPPGSYFSRQNCTRDTF